MAKKRTKKVLDQVWQAPKPKGRFHSDLSPAQPEVKKKDDNGPTPIKPKPASIPILDPDLPHVMLDKMLRKELDGSEKMVPPKELLDHIIPPKALPVTIDEIYDALQKRICAMNPKFTAKNWWKMWIKQLEQLALLQTAAGIHQVEGADTEDDTVDEADDEEQMYDDDDDDGDSDYMEDTEVEDLNRPLTREERVCFVYQNICDAAEAEFPELAKHKRIWTGYFSRKPLVSDVSRIVRKPDMASLKPSVPIPDFKNGGNRTKWRYLAVIGEDKEPPKTDEYFMRKIATEIYNKGYCIMENQPNRRSVHGITNTGDIVRISTMDRGGAVHTEGFNMKNKPKLFLHAMMGLTFAPDEYIGYDPSIEMDDDGKPIRITVGTKTYTINSIVWRSTMIRGRATACFHVSRSGRNYIIKDYWIVQGREPTEIFFLREAMAAGVPMVPTLYDWEDVIVNGRLDTTDNNRGVYKPLLNRIHRRLVFTETASPLYKFASKRELISVLRDAVIAHQKLWEANILHRDISLYNIMIQMDKHLTGLRKGLLIDFDYAKDLKPESRKGDQKVASPEEWPGRPDNENQRVERVLTPPELQLQETIITEFEEEMKIRGHRTGTHPFMAHEILSNKHTVHKVAHDLESFFYILIYLCVMFLGPHGHQRTEGTLPEFLYNWLYFTTEKALGRDKSGLITYSDANFKDNVGKYFTRYMKDLLPCVLRMKAVLKNSEIEEVTHEKWIKIFDDTLAELPSNEQLFTIPSTKFTLGVKDNTRNASRHLKEKDAIIPHTYYSADPNIMTSKSSLSDTSFDFVSGTDEMEMDEMAVTDDDDEKTVVHFSNELTFKGDKGKETHPNWKGKERATEEDIQSDLASQFSFLSINPSDSEGDFFFLPGDSSLLGGYITPPNDEGGATPEKGSPNPASTKGVTFPLNNEREENPVSEGSAAGKQIASSSRSRAGGKTQTKLPIPSKTIKENNQPENVRRPSNNRSDRKMTKGPSGGNMAIQSTAFAGPKDLSVAASAQFGTASALSVAASAQSTENDGSKSLSMSSVAEADKVAVTEDQALSLAPDRSEVTTRNIIPGRTRSDTRTSTNNNTAGGANAALRPRNTSSTKPGGKAGAASHDNQNLPDKAKSKPNPSAARTNSSVPPQNKSSSRNNSNSRADIAGQRTNRSRTSNTESAAASGSDAPSNRRTTKSITRRDDKDTRKK